MARGLSVPRVLQRELGTADPVRPVLLFELEMPECEVMEAVLAQEAQVDCRKIAAWEFDAEASASICDAAERIAAGRLSIACESYAMPQIEERAAAPRLRRRPGCSTSSITSSPTGSTPPAVVEGAAHVVPYGTDEHARLLPLAVSGRAVKRAAQRAKRPAEFHPAGLRIARVLAAFPRRSRCIPSPVSLHSLAGLAAFPRRRLSAGVRRVS
ncbi:hypothetical protein OV079_26565 [Nannocystis pusilla]|uniref:Uncharacterized protein n=1 Tax=Nannocystis pusilla TaxID=889268 RepID=A0A9X3ETN3_9BACT|nr:hypothetical protein [Nannocystis pusilla]MCY1009060.1 hypothetical protein [Nannocystis pusilla]